METYAEVQKVLIETSWNVKNRNQNKQQFFDSINRNIVECKALRILLGISLSVVLIETSWNVKEETYYCDCDGKGY